jgi:hypothetical protein
MSELADLHAKLRRHAARLEGHARELDRAKKELRDHAIEQHDTLLPVHDTVAEYVEAGKAGGVFGLRRLRQLQVERDRLARIENGSDEE